jgi:AcrR family transcriptional regulator
MTELEKGPRGLRRGRGARERILSASQQLFRDRGINGTGTDQICAVAEVSKRTLYQHFTGKDELIAEHLRRFDPDILPEVFDRTDLTPRERLLAAFDVHAPLCPFIAAAVEIPDPGHPARLYARDSRVLNTEAFATAAAIAAVLVDNAIPTTAVPAGASAVEQHDDDAGRGGAPRSGRGAVADHPGQGHIPDRITEQM